MSDELKDLIRKFPEIQQPIADAVHDIVKTGEWATVISEIAYKPAHKFPRTITVKHTCRMKSKYDKRVQSFTCSWKIE